MEQVGLQSLESRPVVMPKSDAVNEEIYQPIQRKTIEYTLKGMKAKPGDVEMQPVGFNH